MSNQPPDKCPICNGSLHTEIRCDKCGGCIDPGTIINQSNPEGGEKEERACPCKYLDDPCSPGCTCVNGLSSSGCLYCATYGSIEQRKAAAERIAGLIKKGLSSSAKVEADKEEKTDIDLNVAILFNQPHKESDVVVAIMNAIAELEEGCSIVISPAKVEGDADYWKEFSEWAAYNYSRLHGVWVHRYKDQTNKENWLTTDQVRQLFDHHKGIFESLKQQAK